MRDLYDDGAGGVIPDFTHVAENLPGVVQLIDLIRDAGLAFGLVDLEETIVETKNNLTNEVYADDDARLHWGASPSYLYRRKRQVQVRKRQAECRKRKKARQTDPEESSSRSLTQDGEDDTDTPALMLGDEEVAQSEEETESAPIAGLLDNGENREFLEDFLQGDGSLEAEEELVLA